MRILSLAFVCLASMATADEPKSFAELYPPLPGVEYFCTDANGNRYELGQSLCVTPSSCDMFMAVCEMSQNNPSWQKLSDGCPTAGPLEQLQRLAEGSAPA